jgi:serine/threonine protein kinase
LTKVLNLLALGQSKASIKIDATFEGENVVTKSNTSEPERFGRQYEKHKQAIEFYKNRVGVPQIKTDLRNSTYSMEYVHGSPLGLLLQSGRSTTIRALAKEISELLLTSTLPLTLDDGEVLSLLLSKSEQLQKNESTLGDGSLYGILRNYFIRKVSSTTILRGWNHGDLSLDNILVANRGSKLYLIDFLDSPAETPLIDWGRIWLDAEYGWWMAGSFPNATWNLNSGILSEEIEGAAKLAEISRDTLDVFAAFAILRVMPYTENPVRLALLKNAARSIMKGA